MAGIEIDRSAVSTYLAKAIAYQQVGKTEEAEDWARKLVEHLQLAGILTDRIGPDVGQCFCCNDAVTESTGIFLEEENEWSCYDCCK